MDGYSLCHGWYSKPSTHRTHYVNNLGKNAFNKWPLCSRLFGENMNLDSWAITSHYYERGGWFKRKCTNVNKQKRGRRERESKRDERHRGCPRAALASAPLETSEVISGTIIRGDRWRRGTVINVTPSSHVPGRGHRDSPLSRLNTPLTVAHNRLLWTSQLLYCCFMVDDLLWASSKTSSYWSLNNPLLCLHLLVLSLLESQLPLRQLLDKISFKKLVYEKADIGVSI